MSRVSRALKGSLALVAIAALGAVGGIAASMAHEDSGTEELAASACPEQTQILSDAGLEFDWYANGECPSVEEAQHAADEARAARADAQANAEALAEARANGDLEPGSDQWVRGVGEDAHPVSDEEVAAWIAEWEEERE